MRREDAAAALSQPPIMAGLDAGALLLELDGLEVRVAPPAAAWRGASPGQRPHAAITRFRAAAARHLAETISIPDLCAEIGVAERTLRTYCRQSFGMSPKRYIRVLRMLSARAALCGASRDQTSVTRIASALGFGNLGLFAVEYRALFGESPSATLRAGRPPLPPLSRERCAAGL
jgi:AraC-like DNA-binding protein